MGELKFYSVKICKIKRGTVSPILQPLKSPPHPPNLKDVNSAFSDDPVGLPVFTNNTPGPFVFSKWLGALTKCEWVCGKLAGHGKLPREPQKRSSAGMRRSSHASPPCRRREHCHSTTGHSWCYISACSHHVCPFPGSDELASRFS